MLTKCLKYCGPGRKCMCAMLLHNVNITISVKLLTFDSFMNVYFKITKMKRMSFSSGKNIFLNKCPPHPHP